jgi:hypothetical protein
MGWASLIVAFLGAGVAIFVPLFVEYTRRPELVVERADDLNIENRSPNQRLVHIKVINRPLTGWRGRWLLRNVATGCSAHIRFISRSDSSTVELPGRWSANPEPLMLMASIGTSGAVSGATYVASLEAMSFDPTKVPQTRVIDVSPGEAGQLVAIALKTQGQAEAYGFASESYGFSDLQNPNWRLPHTEYVVEVVAEAGGLRSEPARFVLRNQGNDYTGLSLAAFDAPGIDQVS